MNESIARFISSLPVETISTKRKEVLYPLIDYIQSRLDLQQRIILQFICTHNSRRSQLCQVWAQVMAFHFKLMHVDSYSGGTESTALYPMVAETLKGAGFLIEKLSDGQNPIYAIKYAKNHPPIIGFSKLFSSDFNPKSDFAAIMTCDDAYQACPMVKGAVIRIPLSYQDPKIFDGTRHQTEKYQQRSLQIATEMFYVFSKINP